MSYTLFILLLRVWDAILGFCLIQYKTKQNRTLGQNGHWLSPVQCIWQGACLAFWLWGEGGQEARGEEKDPVLCPELSLEGWQWGKPTRLFRRPPNS